MNFLTMNIKRDSLDWNLAGEEFLIIAFKDA